jgi:transposase
MLSLTGELRIFLAVEPCDMRKSFNGLYAVVTERLRMEPRRGALFAFTNKRRNRLKLLYWDGTGLWVLAKRLEKGTFCWPKASEVNARRIALSPQAFGMLTDGIDMARGCRRAWYEEPSREH